MQLQENSLVADRFRLIRMIGRGGMGSVWHAFDVRLDTPCALKFIEGELANVSEAHARFQREAKAAAQLRSPHVVEIKDHGVWQGHPYIAMELLDGEDLGKALAKAGGRLPPAQVNAVIQQVCRALTKAHAAGIVHRDLKPDNIFLVADDDRQIVKILDFGVAKQTSQAIDGSNTKTGAMLGTPYYMSPEQAQGIKSVDSRSDLWSLAVIVYQCITGRLPFESEALGDLLVKIIVQPVPTPSSVASVPIGFDRWWAKAAERPPENRFQTAKEFGVQLELALGALSVTEVGMQSPPLHGTAVMGPNPSLPLQHTPNPAAGHATPHPYAGHPTPVAMSGSVPGNAYASVASNPATFSGVEPPATMPKKGPPVAVLAAVAAVILVGVAITGVVVVRGRSSAAATAPSTSTVAPTETTPASATPPSTAPSTPTSAVASTTAAPEPPPSAVPSATAVATAPTPTAAKPAVVNNGGAGKPAVTPTAPKTAAAPTASVKKKWEPGF